MKWLKNKVQIEPPLRVKKVTGTRFASILNKNVWSTPFEMWLAITKTYEKPFEDTIYTIAGKTIEPKQAQYIKEELLLSNMLTPEDVYGKDYFNKTYGDFFKENEIFGGMWDFLLTDNKGKVNTVVEMKTTKRSEDWLDDIPEYYGLQASLYAKLLGIDDVLMVVTFLNEKDYEDPENFVVNDDNTIIKSFKVSKKYPEMDKYIEEVTQWFNDHVRTGISPEFDEKKDAELLKALRTKYPDINDDLTKYITEAEILQSELNLLEDEFKKSTKEKSDRLKKLKDIIKQKAVEEFKEGDKYVSYKGSIFEFNTGLTVKNVVDEEKLKFDGLYDNYIKENKTYTLRIKEIK